MAMRFLATASFFALLGYGQTQVDLNRQVRNALPYTQGGTNATTQAGARANVGTPDLVATDFAGADIGAKVNAAFASFGAGKCGTVTIPPGSYTFSTTIYVPSGCTLKGSGRGDPFDSVEATRLYYSGAGATSGIVMDNPTGTAHSGNTVEDLAILSAASVSVCPNDGQLTWNPAAGGANKWQCYDGTTYTAPLPHLALIRRGNVDPTFNDGGIHGQIKNVSINCAALNGNARSHYGIFLNSFEEGYMRTVSAFSCDYGIGVIDDVNGAVINMVDMQYNRVAGMGVSAINNFLCVDCLFQSNQWFGHPDDVTKYGAGIRSTDLGAGAGRGATFFRTYFEGNHGPDLYAPVGMSFVDVDDFATVRGTFSGNITWAACTVPDASLVTWGHNAHVANGCAVGTGNFLYADASPVVVRTDSFNRYGILPLSLTAFDSGGALFETYRLDKSDDFDSHLGNGTSQASLRLRTLGNATSASGLRLETLTAATSGANQGSAWVHWTGAKWNGAASVPFDWTARSMAETAFTPESTTGLYVFDPSGSKRFGFRDDGTFQVPGTLADRGDQAGTTYTSSPNAGTGAACFSSGFKSSPMAGQVELDMGTAGWAAGAQCDVVFPSFAGFVTLTPANGPAAVAMNAQQVYVTAITNGFRINFGLADSAATHYRFNWTGAATY